MTNSAVVETRSTTVTGPPLRGLARWGTWVARHPVPVLLAWLAVLLLAGALSGRLGDHLRGNSVEAAGSDSLAAAQLIRAHFPEASTETDLVVLHSDTLAATDPAYRQRVRAVLDAYSRAPQARSVADPYARPASSVSADGHTVLVRVGLAGDGRAAQAAAGPLGRLAGGLGTDRVAVYFTGESPLDAAAVAQGDEDLARAESIGLPAAAIVLLLAFGSLVAASLPLLLGFASVTTTLGLLTVLSRWVAFDVFARSTVSMVGIALGIDYSLFLVTRFREEMAASGDDSRSGRAAALGTVLSTAGHAVLYSGTTVMISLAGLFLVPSDRVRSTGLGMMVVVLVMMAVAVTLLPAVLALLGTRVDRLALPWLRRRLARDPERSIWGRFASLSMRRPLVVAGSSAVLLALLALPGLGLRYGADTSAGAVRDTPAGRGLDLVSARFSPGLLSPIEVVIARRSGPLTDADLDTVAAFAGRAAAQPGVSGVTSLTGVLDQRLGGHGAAQLAAARAAAPDEVAGLVDGSGSVTIVTVSADGAADSDAAQAVVRRLRAEAAALAGAGPDGDALTVRVGGAPAELVDMIGESQRTTPLVIGAVLLASWLLLFGAFRSVLLPFKALAMNLFSVGAAFGVMVLVFQDGHGAGWLGVDRTGFIQVMIPLVAFALVFGLSMDYEVFMLSRMREAWQRTGDNQAAVRTGLTRTAPVITAAAAIMIVVFGSFMFTRVTDLKQLGFMLAVAVFIDATVVRLLLVPALMRLMGRWNWWLPGRSRNS